jgi:malate dehydrogenase (oxaloacetate-decarboxylating)
MRKWFIDNCNPEQFEGNLSQAMNGADIFIGVSAPNLLSEADIQSMAKGSIVFALANPDPEIDPVLARKHAAVVATGRSDQPNQINNVLAFPGIFRGLLNASFIVPSVFDTNVVKSVADAVKRFT